MKALAKVWIAVILVLIAVTALAKDVPAPLTKKIPPGITTIEYAGQQVRFSSEQGLIVQFKSLDAIRIQLTVRPYGPPAVSGQGGGEYSTTGTSVDIYWENFGSEIYNGSLTEPYEGILNSESGFTEK